MNEERLRQLIAENIGYYRRQNGDTQADLAEKLNYSDKSVSKWERGDGTPDIFILARIAALYNITVQDLLRSKKVPPARTKRILITSLAVLLVWLVATVVFFFFQIFDVLKGYDWYVFLYAIPASGIVAEVFSALWWNRLLQGISCSLIIWGLGVSVVITLPMTSAFWLYLVCAVLEVLLILFLLLKMEDRLRERGLLKEKQREETNHA